MTTFIELNFCIHASFRLCISGLLERKLLSDNPPQELITSVGHGGPIIVRNMFGNSQRIDDADRYRLIRQCGTLRIRNPDGTAVAHKDLRNDPVSTNFSAKRTLAIILESPHKDEYCDGLIPRGPAMGTTGRNIRIGLLNAIERSSCVRQRVVHGTRVVIMNPVQFQTSLYAIHKNRSVPKCRRSELRDITWNCIWSVQEIRDEFKCRLRNYQPHTVLNLCTGQDKPGTLSRRVTEELVPNFSSQLFVGPHPAWPRWLTAAQFRRPAC